MRNRDDRPWREHHPHVPREFDQASRRADFRWRGAHENDDGIHGHDPRWPGPEGTGTRGPHVPGAADARGPAGAQGYPVGGPPRRRRGAPVVVSRSHHGDAPRGSASTDYDVNDTLASTSGYDDYESEALFGTRFEDGDWPRTYRRGARGSRVQGARVGPGDHRGKGPGGYRRSDERLLEDVHQRLTDDAYLDARRLKIAVQDGVVRLEGTVAQRWMKHHAEHVVARCFGVADVDNQIRVDRPAR